MRRSNSVLWLASTTSYCRGPSVVPVAAALPVKSLGTDGNDPLVAVCGGSSAGCRGIVVPFYLAGTYLHYRGTPTVFLLFRHVQNFLVTALK